MWEGFSKEVEPRTQFGVTLRHTVSAELPDPWKPYFCRSLFVIKSFNNPFSWSGYIVILSLSGVQYEWWFLACALIFKWTAMRSRPCLKLGILQSVWLCCSIISANCFVCVSYVIDRSHVLVWVIVRAPSAAFSFLSDQSLCVTSFHCAIFHKVTDGQIKATQKPLS